jgi:hypothetical protein
MRRLVFGLALIPLVACGSASAGEGSLSAASDGSQAVQRSPSPSQRQSPKKIKQISKTQSRPTPSSLSLSSAETYAAEHSANLPVSSPPKPAAPATNSWTGFYVGAGAGIGAARQ